MKNTMPKTLNSFNFNPQSLEILIKMLVIEKLLSSNTKLRLLVKLSKDKTEIGIKLIHQAPTKFSSVSFFVFIQKSSSSLKLFGSYTVVSFANASSNVTYYNL